MNKSSIARTLGAFIVVFGLLFGLAPAASAATPAASHSQAAFHGSVRAEGDYLDPTKRGSKSPTVAKACDKPSEGVSTSSNLPVNRWTDATAQLFWRLSNTAGLDTALIIQRQNVLSMGMSTGNTMWSLGTGMSAFAISFCVLDTAGGQADAIGAKIGSTLSNSALLSFMVITSILVIMFKGRGRGRIDWKAIAMKGVVVGLFAAMIVGATASTGGGKNGSTAAYRPGIMSPGWVVTTMNNTLASLASGPARALTVDPPENRNLARDGLSCKNYVYQLKVGYEARYGKGTDAMASAVPMILSSLWESTGLQTWRTSQFGTSVRNDGVRMDDNTWCRLLEFNAGTKITDSATDGTAYGYSVRDTMMRSFIINQPGMSPAVGSKVWESPAFNPTSNKDIIDHSLIAWTACIYDGGDPSLAGSWNIRSEFTLGDKDEGREMKKYKPKDCASWYTAGSEEHADAFDWTQNGDNVTGRTTDPSLNKDSARNVRDFIQYLHGNTNTAGSAAVIVYNISALAMLAVFGLLAMAIIIAKIAMVIMIIMAFFVCLSVLLPNSNMDKLTGFLKTLLGMNMFIFAIQMIFALISVITKMLSDAGKNFLGDNELVSTIWTGFSPLLAVFLINMMITKVMKLPSPFKLSGAMAWGAAAGAAGGAASAGISHMLDRKQGQATRAARGAAQRSGRAALGKVAGGRAGAASGAAKGARRGTAAPAGERPTKGKLSRETAAPSTIAGNKRHGSGVPGKVSADGTVIAGATVAGGAAGVAAGAAGSKRAGVAGADNGESNVAIEASEVEAPSTAAAEAQPVIEESAGDTRPAIEEEASAEPVSEPSSDEAEAGHSAEAEEPETVNTAAQSDKVAALEIPELDESAHEPISAERNVEVSAPAQDDSIDGAAVLGAAAAAGAPAAVAASRRPASARSVNRANNAAVKAEAKRRIQTDQAGMTRREQKMDNWNRRAGGLSPEDFMHSRVANSALASGQMGHKDRTMLSAARKLEKAAALKWERDRQLADGAPANVREALGKSARTITEASRTGSRATTAKAVLNGAGAVGKAGALQRVERVKDNWAGLKNDFTQNPVATSRKLAGKTLKYGAVSLGVAAAFPFGIGLAATTGVGAAAIGLHKARKGAAQAQQRTAAMDAKVDVYRAAMRLQKDARENAQPAAQSVPKAGANPGAGPARPVPSVHKESSALAAGPRVATQKRPETAPRVPSAHRESAAPAAAPKTASLPIVPQPAQAAAAPATTALKAAAPAAPTTRQPAAAVPQPLQAPRPTPEAAPSTAAMEAPAAAAVRQAAATAVRRPYASGSTRTGAATKLVTPPAKQASGAQAEGTMSRAAASRTQKGVAPQEGRRSSGIAGGHAGRPSKTIKPQQP
jgi:hypothetical protein